MIRHVLFQCIVRFLILALINQAVYPTWVMAMDSGETAVLSPSFSSHFRESPQEAPPRLPFNFTLDFQIDHKPEEGPEFKTPKVTIPIFETRPEIQKHIDSSLSIQAIYPGLQLVEQGLKWSSLGYDFLMTYQGHLLVVGNPKEGERAKALRIFNPLGNVYLGGNIALKHLLIKSKNIIQASPSVSVEHLEAWATDGGFCNNQGSELKAKTFTLHQGSLANLGLLSLSSGGKIDLQGGGLFNNGQLSLADAVVAQNVGSIINKDRIVGTRYRLDVGTLENEGSITGDNISLNVAKRLLNQGTIGGLVTAIDTSSGILQNEGEIKATQNLILRVKDGVNSGSFYSSGDSSLDIHEDFVTTGSMLTQGAQIVTVRKSLGIQAGATLLGKRKLVLQGSGHIENKGTVKSDTNLKVLNHTFINHNLLHAQGSLLLGAQSKFHNTGMASITAVGRGAISGRGIFQNDTPLQGHTKAGMIFADTLHFDDFRGRFINDGLITAQGDISGSIQTLDNHGLFGTQASFQKLKIVNFSNSAESKLREAIVAGRGHLIIEEGSNQGSIKGLPQLEILSKFSNEGAFQSNQELKIIGGGAFEQKGSWSAEKLVVNTRSFELFSKSPQEVLSELILGPELQRWCVHEDAELESKLLHIQNTQAKGENHGLIKVSKFINEGDLKNLEELQVRDWEQKGSIVNAHDASITVSNQTTLAMERLDNEGDIHLQGAVAGIAKHIENKGSFKTSGSVSLEGKTFSNTRVFKAEGILEWLGETLENHGKLYVFDNQLMATRQVINHQFIFWTHNTFRTRHFLNRGHAAMVATFPKSKDLPHLVVAPDTSTTYKPMRVENRGTLLMSPTYAYRRTIRSDASFEHWENGGTLTARSLKLNAKTFANKGNLNLKGSFQGKADVFDNSGTINITPQQSLSLTGQMFRNRGIISGGGHLIYNGRSIDLNPTSAITVSSLELHVQTPLEMKGTINSSGSVSLSSPVRIINEGKIISSSQQSLLSAPEVINQGQLAVHQLGDITKLVNTSQFTVEQGDTTIADLDNQGHLGLSNGLYTINRWDNKGTVKVDKLSLPSSYPYLNGKTEINTWIGREGGYRDIIFGFGGKTTIHKGSFSASSVTSRSQLALGEGDYKIAAFENHASLSLLPGIKLYVQQFINHPQPAYATPSSVESAHPVRIAFNPRAYVRINERNHPTVYFTTTSPLTREFWGQLSQWKSENNIILELEPAHNVAEVLGYIAAKWLCRKLILRGQTFRPTQDISVPYPVQLSLTDFENLHKLTFGSQNQLSGLELEAKHFVNGQSPSPRRRGVPQATQTFGEIDVYGPLTATITHDVDNHWGKIRGSRQINIVSVQGSIFNGASIVSSPSPERGANGALISAARGLTLSSYNGDINTDFGRINAGGDLRATAKNSIHNLSGIMLSGGDIYLKASRYEQLVGDPYQAPPSETWTPRTYNGQTYNIIVHWKRVLSPPAELSAYNGSIYFNVDSGRIYGSQVLATQNIYHLKGPYYVEGSPPSLRPETAPSQIHHQIGPYAPWELVVDASYIGFIKAGHRFVAKLGDYMLSGSVSAQVIDVTATRIYATNISGQRDFRHLLSSGEHNIGRVVQSLPMVENKMAQGGGLALDCLEERPLTREPGIPWRMPALGGLMPDSFRFLLSTDLLRYGVALTLSRYVGALHIEGKSGDELISHLSKEGEAQAEELRRQGMVITKDHLPACLKPFLYCEVQRLYSHDYLVPHLHVPKGIPVAHAFESGAQIGDIVRNKSAQGSIYKGVTISGRDGVSLESDGHMAFPLEKKTVASRRGSTVIIEEVPDGVHAQVLSERGKSKISAEGIQAVAPQIISKKGNELQSRGGGIAIRDMVLDRSVTTTRAESHGRDSHSYSRRETEQKSIAGQVVASEGSNIFQDKEGVITLTNTPIIAGQDNLFESRRITLETRPLERTVEERSSHKQAPRKVLFWKSGGKDESHSSSSSSQEVVSRQVVVSGRTTQFKGQEAHQIGVDHQASHYLDHVDSMREDPLVLRSSSSEDHSLRNHGFWGFGKKSRSISREVSVSRVVPSRTVTDVYEIGQEGQQSGVTQLQSKVVKAKKTIIRKSVLQSTARNSYQERVQSQTKGMGQYQLPPIPIPALGAGGKGLDGVSRVAEQATPAMQIGSQVLKILKGKPDVLGLAGQFTSIGVASQQSGSSSHSIEEDEPNLLSLGDGLFDKTPKFHIKGITEFTSVAGELKERTSEPLQRTETLNSDSHSSSAQINPLSLSFNYSEQESHHERFEQKHSPSAFIVTQGGKTSSLHIGKAHDKGLSVSLTDTHVTIDDLTTEDVVDVLREKKQESSSRVGFSFGPLLSAAMGNPVELLGVVGMVANNGFGDQGSSHYSVRPSQAPTTTLSGDSSITVVQHHHISHELVEEHSETTDTFGQLLRLASACFSFSMAALELHGQLTAEPQGSKIKGGQKERNEHKEAQPQPLSAEDEQIITDIVGDLEERGESLGFEERTSGRPRSAGRRQILRSHSPDRELSPLGQRRESMPDTEALADWGNKRYKHWRDQGLSQDQALAKARSEVARVTDAYDHEPHYREVGGTMAKAGGRWLVGRFFAKETTKAVVKESAKAEAKAAVGAAAKVAGAIEGASQPPEGEQSPAPKPKDNPTAQSAARSIEDTAQRARSVEEAAGNVEPYEVGSYRDLFNRSKGDKVDIHHAPQKQPAKQVINGYNENTAPAIAVPERLHRRIPNSRGSYEGGARQLLAKTIKDLRNHTDAPNKSLIKLIEKVKRDFPSDFQK